MNYNYIKKAGKIRKCVFSLTTAFAVAVTAFSLPQSTSTVNAATAYESKAPSADAFWTSDQLKGLNGIDLDKKASYGKATWYAIGADGNSLVMLSDRGLGMTAFSSDGNTDYSTSEIKSKLNGSDRAGYNINQLFSAKEITQITDANGGKLYLPDGSDLKDNNFLVGSSNQYKISIASWTAGRNANDYDVSQFFWLRSADPLTDNGVFCVYPAHGHILPDFAGYSFGTVVPAFNLNLSSVLFSSTAPAASSGDGKISDKTMTFRFKGDSQIKSTATYSENKISVAYDETDGDNLYLCVQFYNDITGDYIMAEQISKTSEFDLSSLITDSSSAKIWLEKNDGGLLYAKYVTADPKPNSAPESGKKYKDVAVSIGSIKDITNSLQVEKSENPYGARIVNNTILEKLLDIASDEKVQGVNVWLDIKNTIVDSAAKDKIVAAADEYTVDFYLDINLYKKVGTNSPEKITTLNDNMKISFIVPENSCKAGRNYKLIRLHYDNATPLPVTFNATDNTLTFETDSFSTYAIAYSDTVSAPNANISPKTGDTSNMLVWLFAILSLLVMTGFAVHRKRDKR